MDDLINFVTEGDCLDVMQQIPDNSVDMILTDLPYGTTACAWDSIIDLDQLWKQWRRVLKPNRAVVLTASQPFTTTLVSSNLDWFKYEWIWIKNRPTGFVHAKNKPMKAHENVLVFSSGTTVHEGQSVARMPYYPQGTKPIHEVKRQKRSTRATDTCFSERPSHAEEYVRTTGNFPRSTIEFATDQLGLHPTAKPVALFEYLIRTYTKPNEIVLDNCIGSGTTAIAALRGGRQFIGIEKDPDYVQVALKRIVDELESRPNAPISEDVGMIAEVIQPEPVPT